ncbi:hypothetical protein LOK49_LG14G01093 [Camellia lanceoleosa]|uniref:Uncharacterized protein n=1 Tax=Camellia lanceoleosa TaxID=1840588 RepID=A0ACC0FCZ1_9ERIC|nr:hypothetical protein LOK49_LG14G01093 [Camellia lanceoleosa]
MLLLSGPTRNTVSKIGSQTVFTIEGQLTEVMCTKYLQERKDLVQAFHKDIKLSDLSKITQVFVSLILSVTILFSSCLRLDSFSLNHVLFIFSSIWGRTLVIIKNAGHAINVEKSQEMFKHLKSFLVDPLPPKLESNGNNGKTD